MFGNVNEDIILKENPKMFRNASLLYLIYLILILFYGAGLLLLFIWYLETKAIKLIVTEKRIILRTGLFRKDTMEVNIKDIRNIQTKQRFLQRIFNVGDIIVDSAAASHYEINAKGFKDPEGIKQLIREYRDI